MPTSSPATSNYTLGKGVLSVATYGSAVFTDLGNCPSFEIEPTEETLDHFSSRSGTRNKDKLATLEKGYTLNFTLDELSVENLSLFFKATHTGNAEIQGLMGDNDQEHVLKFVSDNATGPEYTWTFHRLRVGSAGPVGLITEEWAEMSLTAEGLLDSNNPASPWFTIECASTTTTSSSSTTTTTTA